MILLLLPVDGNSLHVFAIIQPALTNNHILLSKTKDGSKERIKNKKVYQFMKTKVILMLKSKRNLFRLFSDKIQE